MGDLRKALDHGDVTIKIESLAKLYEEIVNNLAKLKINCISEKNFKNISMAQFLTDCFCANDNVVVEAVCHLFLKLINEKRIDADFALNYITDLLPAAKLCSPDFIQIIFYVVKFTETEFTSISNPFWIIYQRKPKYLSILLDSFNKILPSDKVDKKLERLAMLFLINSVILPLSSRDLIFVVDWLIYFCDNNSASLDILWKILPWLDIREENFVPAKYLRCKSLIEKRGNSLVLFSLENLHNCNSLFVEAASLIKQPCPVHLYLWLTRNLWKLPCSYWNYCLTHYESFISNCKCPILIGQALPSLLSVYSSLQQAKKLDYQVDESLRRIRICIRNVEECISANADHDHIFDIDLLDHFNLSLRNCEFVLSTFLCKNRSNLSDEFFLRYDFCNVDEFDVNLLTALLLSEKRLSSAVYEIFSKFSFNEPRLTMYILYVILHQFSKESNLNVVKHIAQFSNSLTCLPTIMRFACGLTRSNTLYNVGYRILCDLYTKHEDVLYSQVKPFVIDLCSIDNRSLAIEKIRLVCIICEHSDVDYGVEMLQLLEKIINERKHELDCELISLTLEAISHLCWNEVIDINVAWKMLYGKLHKDNRAIVVRALIKFTDVVAKIFDQNEEDLKPAILESVIEFLCKFLDSTVKDEFFAQSLESLCKFKPSLIQTKYLPQVLQSGLENEIANGQNYVKLFDFVQPNCFTALSSFLSHIFSFEVDSLGRRVFTQSFRNFEKSSDFANVRSILYEKFMDNSISNDLKIDLSIPLMLTFEINVDDSVMNDSTRKTIVTRGRQYIQIFKKLLTLSPVDVDDWRRSIILPMAWKRFMNVYYAGCVSARITELETTPSKKGIVQEKRLDLAWINVRDQTIELMKTVSREIPQSRANCSLALMGLTLAVKDFYSEKKNKELHDSSEESDESIKHWINIVVDSLFVFSCDKSEYKSQYPNIFGEVDGKSTILLNYVSCFALNFLLRDLLDDFYSDELADSGKMLFKILQNRVLLTISSVERAPAVQSFYQPVCFGLAASIREDTVVQESIETLCKCSLVGRFLGVYFCLNKTKNELLYSHSLQLLMDVSENLEPNTLEYTVACYSIAIIVSVAVNQFSLTGFIDRALSIINRGSCGSDLSNAVLTVGCDFNESSSYSDSAIDRLDDWLNEITDSKASPIRRSDIYSSLAAFCGSEFSLLISTTNFVTCESSYVEFQKYMTKIENVLLASFQTVVNDVNSGYDAITYKALFLSVGKLLYWKIVGNVESELPSSYSYIDENLTLRLSVDFLAKYNKSPNLKSEICILVVNALAKFIEKRLPTVDWYHLLWPLYGNMKRTKRTNFYDEISFVKLAIFQSSKKLLTQFLQPLVFNDLEIECKFVLVENVRILLDVFSSNNVSVLEIFGRDSSLTKTLHGNLSNFDEFSDRRTQTLCENYFVSKLGQSKVARYEDVLSDYFLSMNSSISKIDKTKFRTKVLSAVDPLTKFCFLAVNFAQIKNKNQYSNQLIELVEIYVNDLSEEQRSNALPIFAHIFHFNNCDREFQAIVAFEILNSSMISLNTKKFIYFNAYFDLFIALINAISSITPKLPVSLRIETTKENQSTTTDEELVKILRLRFPFALHDCIINDKNGFLSVQKVIDWCVRIITFRDWPSTDELSFYRNLIVDCLRLLRNATDFTDVLSKHNNLIDFLF